MIELSPSLIPLAKQMIECGMPVQLLNKLALIDMEWKLESVRMEESYRQAQKSRLAYFGKEE